MNCQARNAHIVDSRFYRRGYTTEEARLIFCDVRRMQRWLDVELALVRCQAELGVVPENAAIELEKTANISLLDIDAIKNQIAATGHSLIPLLTAWQEASPAEAAQYINYGSTTQDIQDTAQALELRDVCTIVDRDLKTIITLLAELASTYKNSVIIGRTHGQPALPTTFGLKAATWLDELLRGYNRFNGMTKELLVCQLFGGVGTMAAFGGHGLSLLETFARKLQLNEPLCAWHTSRDRFADFLSTLAIIAGSLGKIANEICQLARAEIGELEEPFHPGKIGSTTMPHKRNPELCEQVVVLAKLLKSNAELGYEALINEHERDYRAVRLEWVTLPESSLYFCGMLNLMKNILAKLTVHDSVMTKNAASLSDQITTEALMFALAKKIGKHEAHKIIYETAMQAHDQNRPLNELIMNHKIIKKHFDKSALLLILDPRNHIGQATDITDRVLIKAEEYISGWGAVNQAPLSCPLAKADCCCRNNS